MKRSPRSLRRRFHFVNEPPERLEMQQPSLEAAPRWRLLAHLAKGWNQSARQCGPAREGAQVGDLRAAVGKFSHRNAPLDAPVPIYASRTPLDEEHFGAISHPVLRWIDDHRSCPGTTSTGRPCR